MTDDKWQRIGETAGFAAFMAQIETHKAEMGIGDPPDIEPCEFSRPGNPHSPKTWPDGSYCDGFGYLYDSKGAVYPKRCPCWIEAKSRNLVDDYKTQLTYDFRKLLDCADDSKFACGQVNQKWWPAKTKAMVLIGQPGTGKTVAGHKSITKMIEAHAIGGYYINARHIAADCSSLATNTDERSRAEERLSQHWLACRGRSAVFIDDLGRERQSDATLEKMREYVDALYERRAPCIIATNLTGVQIRARYGGDIMSRLSDTGWMTHITISGKDLRLPQKESSQVRFQSEKELFAGLHDEEEL